jgi:hypothetical protein
MSALCQKQTLRGGLLDDLVRLGGEIGWHIDAERLSGLEVNYELKFGGLHHRQVPRLFTLENPPGIDARLAIAGGEVSTIAHQATRQRMFALLVNRGNGMARYQSDYLVALAVQERIGTDQHCSGPQLRRSCKSGIDFTLIARRQKMYLLANSMRRFFNVPLLTGVIRPVRIEKYGD